MFNIATAENPAANKQLSADEHTLLARCEDIIDRGRKAFRKVGEALSIIREQRLYRQTHSDFESYCRERWGFSKRAANYQIAAAATMKLLEGNSCSHLPATESVLRPLTKVDPGDVAAVWDLVAENAPKDRDGKPRITAKLVAQVVREFLTPGEDLDAEPEESEPPDDATDQEPAERDFVEAFTCFSQAMELLASIPRENRWREFAFELFSDWIDKSP